MYRQGIVCDQCHKTQLSPFERWAEVEFHNIDTHAQDNIKVQLCPECAQPVMDILASTSR